MDATSWIIMWWAAFGLSHMLLAQWRGALINRMGLLPYMLVYNAAAFATFIPLVMVYLNNRHAGGLLWAAPSGLQHGAMLLALLGIALVLPSLVRPSPVSVVPGASAQAHGLMRITRHPLFTGFALWGIAHCMINGFVTDVLFFGGFALFSLVGAAHQDSRKRREQGERLGQFYTQTSLIPFAAILSGRNKLVLRELPWVTLILGAVLAAGLYLLHPIMFG